MLCTVQTTHGRTFRRCGIEFGPRPLLVFVGPGNKPKAARRVSAEQWARIVATAKASAGVLEVAEDVSSDGTALHAAALSADTVEAYEAEVAKLSEALAERDAEIAKLKARVKKLGQEVKKRDKELAKVKAELDEANANLEELTRAD